ncbi:zinc finger, PMZ-type containing protein [Tanacetum coccineum]|uniref:Zinc finger, PMZ-type containing protein n=1 Tax=Tanacetum coccineum TaxID=301880 RepID=A0ABQ5G2H8_9ASTR
MQCEHGKYMPPSNESGVAFSIRDGFGCSPHALSWIVYPSGFREVEVRRRDYAYRVNLHTKQCGCRFWELSGIPCVHVMAAYYHMNMEPKLGVNEFLSKQSWYNAYQYSIRPVPGSKLWKPCDNPTPLPPIQRKRPRRPKKNKGSDILQKMSTMFLELVGRCTVIIVGRLDTTRKVVKINQETNPQAWLWSNKKRGNTNVLAGSSKKRGTIRIGSPIKRGEENQVTKGGSIDDGRKGDATEEAEQERIRHIWAKNEANYLYWENMAKEFRDEELPGPEDSLDNAYSFDTISDFQDNELNVHQVSVDLPVNEAPENYTTEESQAEDPDPKPIVPTHESQIQTRSKIRKQVAATTSMRIFVKNRGRSERIAMMKAKKFKFDANGTGSTADKAFDVSKDEE